MILRGRGAVVVVLTLVVTGLGLVFGPVDDVRSPEADLLLGGGTGGPPVVLDAATVVSTV